MLEVLKSNSIKKSKESQPKQKQNKRQTYFCVGVSCLWKRKRANQIILKKLRNKYELKWLRISMSYHKFSNLREIFNGDLTTKLMERIKSQDYRTKSCNCNVRTKVDGQCIYKGQCRKSIVVYKATCKCCGKFYIGNTQNKVKDIMYAHLNETRNLVRKGIKTDFLPLTLQVILLQMNPSYAGKLGRYLSL